MSWPPESWSADPTRTFKIEAVEPSTPVEFLKFKMKLKKKKQNSLTMSCRKDKSLCNYGSCGIKLVKTSEEKCDFQSILPPQT